MKKAVSNMRAAILLSIALTAPVLAQNQWRSEGVAPAAKGPAFNVSLGYSFLSMAVPGAGRVNINGVDASGGMDFKTRWGVTIDANDARTGNVLGTGRAAYILTLMAGPVFYPFERGGTRIFLRALGGAGLVNGAAPKSPSDYRHGWVEGGAYAFGGGVERAIAGPFAIRFGGDYLRTNFFNYAGSLEPQNNFRMTVGVEFPSPRRTSY